jgi:Ca-activated chloride channel family protein
MILQAQSEKAIATDEILNGDSKSATKRLKGTAANLRIQASEIRVTDERSAESLAIILEEAAEMDALAQTAEHQDLAYSSKRVRESYSRMTRSKNIRPTQDSDETTNPDFLN